MGMNDFDAHEEDLLDLNEVMRAFGVLEWKNLGTAETSGGDQQPEQVRLLVEVAGQRYVLRERTEGMLGEDLLHRYAFRRYLQLAGIPLPDLWLTPEGEPAVQMGEENFELQRWPDGSLFSSGDSQSQDWTAAAGSMLARLHQASQRYRGDEHHWPAEAHMGGLVQNWLNLARARVETSEVQAIAAALSEWVEQCERVLPGAMMSIGAGHNLPEFHIHGDYHPLNLRFSHEGVTAVLGLEASRWEKRIFEVAYALFSFCALQWQPGERLNRPLVKRGLDPHRAERFLRAYGAMYPPVRDEALLLVDALTIIAPILTINGPLEDLFYSSAPLARRFEELQDEQIEEILERLSWAIALPAWLGRVRRPLAEMWG